MSCLRLLQDDCASCHLWEEKFNAVTTENMPLKQQYSRLQSQYASLPERGTQLKSILVDMYAIGIFSTAHFPSENKAIDGHYVR